MDIRQQVQERAYALWVEEGCVNGRADDYWFRAERELKLAAEAAPAGTAKARTKAPVKRRPATRRAA